MQSEDHTGAFMKEILNGVPEDASPRRPWPFANPRKQAAIESKFFEDDATINFERLAPLQSWASLAGLDMQMRTNFIAANVVRLAGQAQMRLSQAEIDSIAETSAKNFKRGAWASPTAMLFAGAAVYHGRAEFKFPFYKPVGHEWFHPEAFPSTRWTILRGSTARIMWHSARGAVYYPLFKIATTFFYSSIMRMSIAGDVFRDPRMARVRDTIMHQVGVNNPRMQRQHQHQHQHDQNHTHMGQSDSEQRDETYRRVGLPPPSPAEMSRFSRQRQTPASGSGEQGDAQGPVEWTSAERQQTPVPSQSGSSGAWGDSELFDDDASPVSPAARRAEQAGSAPQQQPGTSSWARIRQQAKTDSSAFSRGDRSGQETSWSKVQQEAATPDRGRERGGPSDNYTYSETDEAKGYAKSQAQKEFDAMLEAERKGESSSSGRWR